VDAGLVEQGHVEDDHRRADGEMPEALQGHGLGDVPGHDLVESAAAGGVAEDHSAQLLPVDRRRPCPLLPRLLQDPLSARLPPEPSENAAQNSAI